MTKLIVLVIVCMMLSANVQAIERNHERKVHPNIQALVESKLFTQGLIILFIGPILGGSMSNIFFYINYYVYFFFCNSLATMYFYDYPQTDMVGMCMVAA